MSERVALEHTTCVTLVDGLAKGSHLAVVLLLVAQLERVNACTKYLFDAFGVPGSNLRLC